MKTSEWLRNFDKTDHDALIVALDKVVIPEVAQLEAIHETFDNQPTRHLLRLIADDLRGAGTSADVKRARANWLVRFAKALGGE